MKRITLVFFVFTALSLAACKGNKDSTNSTEKSETAAKSPSKECSILVTVMNYTGLDGCRYLLKLKDGSFINPNSGVTMDELADCQQAMINYTVKNDAASYCMKGQIADITCFSVVKKGEPVKPKNEF
ncbi:MAG: hypothetical protein ACI94Y_003921 [Maribacter sp.]|jgi:aerobic-type carbon monoxide dehydrogenase small subunit (CoxS/CutS family)